MKFLIGTYTRNESKGIYKSEIINNKLATPELLFEAKAPSYLATHNNYIYSIYNDGHYSGLRIFTPDKLIIDNVDAGKGPCYVSYDQKRHQVYTANYHRGEIRVYKFYKDKLTLIDQINLGNNSHVHQTYYDHKLRRLIVIDLGLDTIFFFRHSLRRQRFVVDVQIKLSSKSGPRHAVINHKNHKIYCLCEHSNQIYIYDYKKKTLSNPIKTTSDLIPLGQLAGAIRIFNDDLYVSNRGKENTIVHFKITPTGLEYKQAYETFGTHPRDFNITDDGKYIVCANLETNNITLFARRYNGDLEFLDSKPTPEPTNITFI